jgi:hypothetical protein
MQRYAKALIALLVVCSLVLPSALLSQQLAVPVNKSILPGVTNIEYAGQTLVFTSSVALRVKLQMVSLKEIELTVLSRPGEAQGAPAQGGGLQIWWENWDEELYDGEPPDSWTGILNTEGGWTEK